MPDVILPGGHRATLKPVLHSTATAVRGVLKRTVRAEANEEVIDFVGETLLLLVESWDLEQPLTADGIAASPERVIAKLYTEALQNFRAEAEDELPKA